MRTDLQTLLDILIYLELFPEFLAMFVNSPPDNRTQTGLRVHIRTFLMVFVVSASDF
jgi:hypothetical protein